MRVLLLEDVAETAAYLRKGLIESGFSVDAGPRSPAMHKWATSGRYDLIVVDRHLPMSDGWLSDLCRAAGETPVLLASTRRSAFSHLLAAIRGTLGGESLHTGDLEIDGVALRATRAGRRLDLTPTEFRLLMALARHAGQVLSRALLADQVWGINFDPKTNVVDVHVRRLRAKLDEPFASRLIHTVRGMGYILEDRSDQVGRAAGKFFGSCAESRSVTSPSELWL